MADGQNQKGEAMNHLIGTLVYAGDLDVNNDQLSGCAVEIDRATLIKATALPMYRKCVIMPVDEQAIADMIGAMSQEEYPEDIGSFAEQFNGRLKCAIEEYFNQPEEQKP